jgi:hypothetical protein
MTIRFATVDNELATAATGRRTARYENQSQGDRCFRRTGAERVTASQVRFPMMKVKRNCGVGLVFPRNSQYIPEIAKATPSRNSCSRQNPISGVSFGNGHTLLIMNVLLSSIARTPNR